MKQAMKLNPTIALTLVLLALMAGAGVVSAAWGIALGREALKGVTQPDTHPASNIAKRQGAASHREEFTVLKEDDIISSIKARMSGNVNGNKSAAPSGDKAASTKKFPLVAQSEDVVLEINAIRRQGQSVVLQTNLRNNSDQPIQFLYTNLVIKDEQQRELSASTDGLPSDLPANSDTYTGTISLPIAALNGVNKVSLSLSDLSDQNVKLQLNDIPIPQQ
jgi:hypothetical protein